MPTVEAEEHSVSVLTWATITVLETVGYDGPTCVSSVCGACT